MKRDIVSIFLSLLLVLSVSGVMADGISVTNTDDISIDQTADPEVTTFETDSLTVQVPTSNVPFYFFWETGDNSSTYRVQFDALYEAIDNNTNDQFDPANDTVIGESMRALASWSWTISDAVTDTSNGVETTSFNLTGVDINPVGADFEVQFRNHLVTDESGTDLKFDVVINNYEWTSASEDNLLVLAYKLQTTDASYSVPAEGENRAEFGAGFFDAVPTASNTTGQEVSDSVKAAVTTGVGSSYNESSSDNSGRIYLSYTYFTGDLVHDPTIGIDQSQVGGDMTLTSGDIAVMVPSSQVPFFFFYNNTEENPETYEVKFFLMYEVNDTDGDGVYDENESVISESTVALPSMAWSMSDLANETDSHGNVVATHFNLTGSATIANVVQSDLEVQFRVHIDQSNDASFKYDVVINNYNWIEDSEDSILVLGYKLTTNSSDYSGSPDVSDNSAQFGNGYFSSVDTAEANGTEIAASVSGGNGNGDDEGMIYQSYQHFEGNMTHDPTLGLSVSSDDTSDDENDDGTTSNLTGNNESSEETSLNFNFIALLSVMFVAIPVVSRRVKK